MTHSFKSKIKTKSKDGNFRFNDSDLQWGWYNNQPKENETEQEITERSLRFLNMVFDSDFSKVIKASVEFWVGDCDMETLNCDEWFEIEITFATKTDAMLFKLINK